MNGTHTGRFKGLPWFNRISEATVFVGGAGGISSWLTLFLSRAGARVIVIDNDTVGEENLAGQCYGKEDIGKYKVDALSDVITRLCGENKLTPLNALVDSKGGQWPVGVQQADIVCVGFDNLAARKLVYDQWKANGKEESFFIDGRLAAESGQIFILEKRWPSDYYKAYEDTYFPENERVELPCTMKATTHCGALIASLMTAQIMNWCNNTSEETMDRQLSNMEFHLQIMAFDQPAYKLNVEENVIQST